LRVPGACPYLGRGLRTVLNLYFNPMIEMRTTYVRAVLAAALLLLGASPAWGQQPMVQGFVREAGTGAPVAGATVQVDGTARRTTSDAAGAYRLAVPGGGARLTASGPGYAPASVSVPAEGGAALDFALAPAPVRVPEVEVVASGAGLSRVPGSVGTVTAEELRVHAPLSANEVLRRLPGVHVQEEEGFGLRANIGVRGLDPDRSRGVLVLEDGVPVALNPYGEPEMYYSPPIERMQRVEVVKGSGSILFGPQTIGGVVNYVTPAPPVRPVGTLALEGGPGGFLRGYGTYGGTWNGAGAWVGVLHKRADDVSGLHFDVTDVTGKVGMRAGRSDLGLKLSVYDEASNSTYVGLTQAMFAADPHRHPAPNDVLRVRRYAASLSHELPLGGAARLRTSAYAYTTSRDWNRQDYAYRDEGSRIELLATSGGRNRSFEVFGIEPRLQWTHALFGLENELDAGMRAQHERAEDTYVIGASATSRAGNVRDFEVRSGRALSGFVQNRFRLSEALEVVPGVRAEWFGYDRNILRTRVRRVNPATGAVTRLPEDVDVRSGDRLFEVIPGIGATWNPDPRATLFAGAHRGFAPPRVKDALVYDDATLQPGEAVGDPVSLQLDAERSWNLEAGARLAPTTGVFAEATAFFLDFSNQIIEPSLSAGSVAQAALANQGRTRHHGVESALTVDAGAILGRPWSLTAGLRHTWVDARFSADRFIQAPGGDTLNVRGNRLPYAPEHLLSWTFGYEHPRGLRLGVDGLRVGSQFADNFETVAPTANGRNGRIPAYTVWNASAGLRLPYAGMEVYGTLKNLAGATYVASRRPEGIKPGLPRMLQVGLRTGF
jgi:Fe(3+) dicitrate transport protein